MIFIDIDFAISKTDTIFFNFNIAYVFHLAHAWILLSVSLVRARPHPEMHLQVCKIEPLTNGLKPQ
jgi:hypothetical protein